MAANSREAAQSLRKAKLRTLLALIGIVIGIGSVIAMISLGEVAKATARAEYEMLGTDILIIKARDETAISLADALTLQDEEPSIRQAAPRIRFEGKFKHAGRIVGKGPIQGITASFARANKLKVETGRFISDLDSRRRWCVIGAEVANAMRQIGTQQIIGRTIETNGWLFTIVGILHEGQENYSLPVQIRANHSIFVPITTMLHLRPTLDIDLIVTRVQPDVHPEAAARKVRSWFQSRNPNLKIKTTSAQQLIAQMESQMKILTLLLAAVGSISLIVGGIGVMNIMLVAVTERRREIGIRRALGARCMDIQSQFLIESIMLTMVGGVLGVILGSVSTWAICLLVEWEFFVSGTACLVGIIVSSAVGIFFGFQPAYKAARLDPVVCLQAE